MADLVDRMREELRVRLEELRPAVQEHDRLAAALRALGDAADDGRTRASQATRRRPRTSGSTEPASAERGQRRGRPRAAPGANREAVLRAVQERPGASSAELANVSGVHLSSVSRLLNRLVRDGELQEQPLPSGRKGYAISKGEPAEPIAVVATKRDQPRQPIPPMPAGEADSGSRAPE